MQNTELSDYISKSVDLTFTPGVTSLEVSVPIIDDGIPEFNEQFFGFLNTSDPDVLIRPHRATVNILPNAIVNLTTENAVEVISNLTSVVAEATSEDDQTPENLKVVNEVLIETSSLLDEDFVVGVEVYYSISGWLYVTHTFLVQSLEWTLLIFWIPYPNGLQM